MNDFTGLHGLIVGVANKRSIAWAIAKAVAGRGARLALTYQGERLEANVRELAAELADPLILPLDVTSDEEITAVATRCDEAFGGIDFVVHGAAYAPREELSRPFLETSREGFRVALDISAYSLVALTRAMTPLLEGGAAAAS
jgi:enoyl-[acyl-carrier protein] reductase I